MRRALVAMCGAAALALSLAACAPEPDAGGAPTPGASDAAEGQTPTAAAEPTCETIIPADVVSQFDELGWTASEQDFHIGTLVVPDGIHCVWGDHSVASDQVQIYGWAPIDDATAAEAQASLEEQGWIREEADGTVLLTEDPAYAIVTDDEGYGMTYEFGDGWVRLADTKQGLVLVGWPPA